MDLLVTVAGVGDRSITAGPDVVVADLVTALGGSKGQVLTVRRTASSLDRDLTLAEADVRSGDVLDLRNRSTLADAVQGEAPVTLKVVEGPAKGTAFELTFGETSIGRVESNDITIVDPGISRRHATITVSRSSVVIADHGSTNGVLVDGKRIDEPATVDDKSQVNLGETVFFVHHRLGTTDPSQPSVSASSSVSVSVSSSSSMSPSPTDEGVDSGIVIRLDDDGGAQLEPAAKAGPEFHRRARSLNRYEGSLVELPMPPERPGRWTVSRLTLSQFERDTAHFHDELRRLGVHLADERRVERERRLAESPSVTETVEIAAEAGPRLWERSVGDHDMLHVRLGLATLPSRNRISAPDIEGEPNDEIADFVTNYRDLEGVPLVADLGPGLQVAGPKRPARDLASALVVQLATLHSPTDLVIAAAVGPDSVSGWEWLKWLPHTGRGPERFGVDLLTAAPSSSAALSNALVDLLRHRSRRQAKDADQDNSTGRDRPWPSVVLVVDDDANLGDDQISELVRQGPDNDIHLLWVADQTPALPRPLGTTVTVTGSVSAIVTSQPDDPASELISIETCGERTRVQVARDLCPIIDRSGRSETVGITTGPIALAELLAASAAVGDDDWALPSTVFKAPVGKTSHGVVSLDLNADGPHAVVVGDRSSGKSEFLRTWVAALIAGHSPAGLNLHLIGSPRGGGPLLAGNADAPHVSSTVGAASEAGPALSRLRREVLRRMDLASDEGSRSTGPGAVSDDPAYPPVVVVIDDVLAWTEVNGDFIGDVIDLCQRARDLGVHLVTSLGASRQRLVDNPPEPVEAILTNPDVGIMVALRTTDDVVSEAVLGTDAASDVDRLNPGRGWVRVGDGRPVLFQGAMVTTTSGPDDHLTLVEFPFDRALTARPGTRPSGSGAQAGRSVGGGGRHTGTPTPASESDLLDLTEPVVDAPVTAEPEVDVTAGSGWPSI